MKDLPRRDLDVAGAQPRDAHQRLGVQEREHGGHAVGEGVLGAGKAAGQQVQRVSWVISGIVLAVRKPSVSCVFSLLAFAQTMKVRIKVRVVGPSAIH